MTHIKIEITPVNRNNYKVFKFVEITDRSKLESLFSESGTKTISWNGSAWELDGQTVDLMDDCGIGVIEEWEQLEPSGGSINMNQYDTIVIGGIVMAASTAPISTYKTYLMYKAEGSNEYTKLIDIKNFPDLGGEPERIDVTTLSDPIRKYVPGVQDLSSFTFNANYIAADYQKIQALSGKQTDFSIWIGATTENGVDTPTGANGKWDFTGDIMCFKAGGDVNAAQDMTVVAFPSTNFIYSLPS